MFSMGLCTSWQMKIWPEILKKNLSSDISKIQSCLKIGGKGNLHRLVRLQFDCIKSEMTLVKCCITLAKFD